MNEVITKLYEIEEKAEQILEDSKYKKIEMQTQLEEEKKRCEQKMRSKMQSRLVKVREDIELKAKRELETLEKRNREQLEKLDELYDDHLNELAQEIFERIIEV